MTTHRSPHGQQRVPVEEFKRGDLLHLNIHHWVATPRPTAAQTLRAAATGGSLPYDLLNERTFERLCFHILLSQGKMPRFWGHRGHKQHGIDLIFSDGNRSTVYQCKHHKNFGTAKLKKALDKFECDWLHGNLGLKKPKEFVLCTTAQLDETAEWQRCKEKFQSETGVNLEEWHRGTLDDWLRDLPGIVADVFGDQTAAQFCHRGRDWDLGLFRPLVYGSDKRVDRYFELRDAGKIVRHPADESAFNQILKQRDVVLLGGLAGTGKTMAALELASAFEDGAWRVFYLRPEETHNVDALFTGIRDRAFRPSIFVLDDCHLTFDEVRNLLRRWLGRHEPVKLVLTARTAPENKDFLEPVGVEFVEEMRDNGQLIENVADEARFRAIVAARKPEWDDPPIDRLMDWTGRDLTILDLVLDTVEAKDLDDVSNLEVLFPKMKLKLFGGRVPPYTQNLRQLAAVAQFDIAVPDTVFPNLADNKHNAKAIQRFVVVSPNPSPSALSFYHPSAAELVFRMLSGKSLADTAAGDCVAVLKRCAESDGGSDYAINNVLPSLLRTHLKLMDDLAIKRVILRDPHIQAMIDNQSTDVSEMTLRLATFLSCQDEVSGFYSERLAASLENLVTSPSTTKTIAYFNVSLRTLCLADADRHRNLEQKIGAARMKTFIVRHGALIHFLKILENSTKDFAEELLRRFTADDLATLVERSIDMQDSLGHTNYYLRMLARRALRDGTRQTQLDLFEDLLGADGFWRLILGAGNLNHLVYLLKALSPAFRSVVISPGHAPGPEGWVALARRGSLYSPARFACDGLAELPDETAGRFRSAVKATALQLAAESTWGEIGSALAKTKDLADGTVRSALMGAAQQRIQAVDDVSRGIDEYKSATDFLSVMWWYRPDLQSEIGARLWKILPAERTWPRSHRLLIQARHILTIARSPHVSEVDARRALDAFKPLAPDLRIDQKGARHHALFLWNLYALWFQRCRGAAKAFRDLQGAEVWDRFVQVVGQRKELKHNPDKLDTLMLAGALAFLVPELSGRLTELIRGHVVGIQFLVSQADKLHFIPAFLACQGMALSAPEQAIFIPARIRSLLEKVDAYEERGEAIESLCAWLQQRR